MISGSPTMVVKPDWYDSEHVPGTRIFKLEKKKKRVEKFMSVILASGDLPDDFTALGSDHCNQTSKVSAYKLVPLSIDELNNFVLESTGGKKKRYKTRKMNKQKKIQ